MNTLEKFRLWADQNETYLNRFMRIIERQVQNQRNYVDLFSRYPANSVEFKIEVERLYNQISPILDDVRENNQNLMDNMDLFKEVMEELGKDIGKLPETWDENE